MKQINMVDLRNQYYGIKDEIDQAIQDVLESAAFIKGPQVKSFSENLREYLDVEHVIPCGNGTDALQIALMALELEPGDEVITPDFTFISTAEVIKLLGLKPVFVDVNRDDFNISTDKLREAITERTRVVIPVHLFGQCANMDEINNLAREQGIKVIEDAAQALGADYYPEGASRKAGTLGDIGCTSFFPSKNLGCYGDGGAIFTNNPDYADKISTIANHGSHVKYYHSRVGINSRLDTIQAAILDVKLQYLDQYNQARQNAAEFYYRKLKGTDQITLPAVTGQSSHIYHQYTLKLEKGVDREDLKKFLKSRSIPSMVYYPVPMHLQEAFNEGKYSEGDFPVSEELCRLVLSIPMHTEMDEEQLNHITETIKKYFAS
ncbi:MAG: DegT/DnrJ/EryC1/StrS family aminotransferase [Bacteroidota bacterium]